MSEYELEWGCIDEIKYVTKRIIALHYKHLGLKGRKLVCATDRKLEILGSMTR